jgi:2-polyprenyl-3-methyl-5-hydroxy-6-metoxy-1,4-benzoquinol methylase
MSECIACAAKDVVDLGKPPLQRNHSPFRVHECGRCGLRWSYPMPTKAELDAYYRSYYQRKRGGTITKTPRAVVKEILGQMGWFRGRQMLFLRLINSYHSKGVLLDYGCGDGQMLLIAKQNGWDVLGVDYSAEFAERLRSRGIKFCSADNLHSSGIPPHSIDCLVAIHVIEHIPDMQQFLLDCRSILKPNGLMAIKTPSRSSLRAKLGLAKWHHVNPPEHQWSFLPSCFRLVMESHGFEVVYLRNSLIVDELISIVRIRHEENIPKRVDFNNVMQGN